MTRKQIRARLDRLELSARAKETKREEAYKPPVDFPIDPAVVQEIEDEYAFLFEVKFPRYNSWTDGERPTPEETQTRARIAALASTIHCPPSYGFQQYWEDDEYRRGRQNDPEKAQARARMEAYKQSPEGRARLRLNDLENGDGLRGLAAYEEMERLLKLYPQPWCNPRVTYLVTMLLQKRGTPKDRKLHAEKHQYWINKSKERDRSKIKPGRIGTTHYVKDYIEALGRNGCPTFGESETDNAHHQGRNPIILSIIRERIELQKTDYRLGARLACLGALHQR
jgi:hypothetical protein